MLSQPVADSIKVPPAHTDLPFHAHGVSLAPYVLRYLAQATSFRLVLQEDEFCELLIEHIHWPRDAQRVIDTELKSTRRRGEPVDDEGDERDETDAAMALDPVSTALSTYSGGMPDALRLLAKRRPQWLRGVFARSLKAIGGSATSDVHRRLTLLKPVFGWNEIDVAVAEVAWLASRQEVFCEWLDNLPGVSRDACAAYARVLGVERHVLRPSLAANGALARSGLVLFRHRVLGFRDPPQLSTNLLLALDEPDFSTRRLAERLLPACPDPDLGAADFAHLAAEVDALTQLMRHAAERRCKGVNVLIYGPPGTGKTQLARWLIHRSLLHGYEIPTTDTEEDADRISDQPVGSRLGLLRSAQRLLGQAEDAVLLFDEIEDAFPVPGVWGLRDRDSDGHKAWINEVLENCPVPILWVGNSVHHMDPAFLRRFTYHLEVPRPSRAVRRRITASRAQREGLSAEISAPLAEFADATPAMIDSALRFATLASPPASHDARHQQVAKLAIQGLKASLSVCGLDVGAADRVSSMDFNPAFVNLRPHLSFEELIVGLRQFRQATLCLYGVPGTGKTSFAEHLAEELGQPLHLHRASDLQSKWIGDCEKNIRKMFDTAQREGALLLLDEADAFLYDRLSAREVWQRSQVNELLQGMERFEGIFVAATNLIDTIDPAALRRFTYKLEFLPLTESQRSALFIRSWPGQLSDADFGELERRLRSMEGVTQGDIAVVVKQNSIRRTPMSVGEGLDALRSEVSMRRGNRPARIGFVT